MTEPPSPGPRDPHRLPAAGGPSPDAATETRAPGDLPSRRRRGARSAALVVVPAVVGSLATVGVLAGTGNLGDSTTITRVVENAPGTTPASAAPATAPGILGRSPTIPEIVRAVSPGVVLVTVRTANGEATGSGFLIDREGHIVTNEHVVEKARSVRVGFADRSERAASVVGADPTTDVAVLKVASVPPNAHPLTLGSNASLVVGDPVLAIGNPFGLEGTVTSGIVSALQRPISAPDARAQEIQNAIQTDAAINPGNSGGPLLDGNGRVVGVNSQIASQSGGNEGIGFALPVDTVRPIVASIIRTGRAQHAWIGISGFEFSPDQARRLGLSLDTGGLGVQCVTPGSPAAQAGLEGRKTHPKGWDVFVTVDGRPIVDFADLAAAIASRPVGDVVTVVVNRGGKRVQARITLRDRPAVVPAC